LRGVVAQRLEGGKSAKLPLFVGKTLRTFTSDPDFVPIPAGAQLGDIIVMVTTTDLTTGFGPTNTAGWQLLDTLTTTSSYRQTVWTKILTAADLAVGSFQVANTHSPSGVTCTLVYRNVSGINVRGSTSNSAGTPMDFSFSPVIAAPSKVLVACAFNRFGPTTGWAIDGKWAAYASIRANFNSTGFYCFAAEVLISPPVPSYDGSTFTLDIPSGGDTGAQFLELV
jgi:hypothetical protein